MRTTAIAPGPQRGNTLIEFSLTAVVLFLLSCGVADFSKLVILNRMADGAAAAGTRYGALTAAHYGDLTGMQNAALADTGNYPDASAVATQFCPCADGALLIFPAPCNSSNPQTYIQVTVTIPFVSMLNYPWARNPIHLTSTSVARLR